MAKTPSKSATKAPPKAAGVGTGFKKIKMRNESYLMYIHSPKQMHPDTGIII